MTSSWKTHHNKFKESESWSARLIVFFFFFPFENQQRKRFTGTLSHYLEKRNACMYPLMVWKLGSEWNGLLTSRIYSNLWVILHSLIKEKRRGRRRRIKTKKGSHSVWNDRWNRVLLPLVYLQTQQYGSVSSFRCMCYMRTKY